jgi:hypothetical protein
MEKNRAKSNVLKGAAIPDFKRNEKQNGHFEIAGSRRTVSPVLT